VGQFVLGLATALFLNRANLWGKTFLLAAVVLPMVIPAVIQSLIWSSMLAMGEYGTLNRILGLIGTRTGNVVTRSTNDFGDTREFLE
jgi:ABC-type sugar transport system permease subunit